MLTAKRKRFIVDENGKPQSIILDIETYNHMLELIEDNEDVKEYKKAKPKVDASIKAGDYVTLKEFQKHRPQKKNAVWNCNPQTCTKTVKQTPG